jgi:Universal stress protein family
MAAAIAGTGLVAVLVLAPRGRTGWSRVVAGSVTASVVRDAAVPVLVVPARPTGELAATAPGTAAQGERGAHRPQSRSGVRGRAR